MVQLIKKRIYKSDQSYTYNFYKVVENKKKRISSKKYHEYIKRIKKKRRNNIPLILIKSDNGIIQYGGALEEDTARDFKDLTAKIRKYKNNPELNLSKVYIIKHGIITKDDGSFNINIETEAKIKSLLELTDFEPSTRFIYMDDPDGTPKKYMVLIPNDKDLNKMGRYIEKEFKKKEFNQFSLSDNKAIITKEQVEEYFEDFSEIDRMRVNLKEKVDGQTNKQRIFTKQMGYYLKFIYKINARFGLKLNTIKPLFSFFTGPNANVDALDTQVIFSLITNGFSKEGQRGFFRTPNPVKYDVGQFKLNYATYKATMADHDYREFARFCRMTLEPMFQLNSYHYNKIVNISIDKSTKFDWENWTNNVNLYREHLRKSFVPGVGKIQCAMVKIVDDYFKIINEKNGQIAKKFMGNNGVFTLNTSSLCQFQVGGSQFHKGMTDEEEKKQLPNENIMYDVFQGFRPNDSFNPGKLVEFIEQILQYEISMIQILKLIEINHEFEHNIQKIIKDHTRASSKTEARVETYKIECDKFDKIIKDADIPILMRINKLIEYYEFVEKTYQENNEFQIRLEEAYSAFNFDFDALIKGNISADIEGIDRNDNGRLSRGLIDLRNTYKSKIANTKNEQGVIVQLHTFLEFYATYFKKFIIKEDETCGLISDFNFEKIASCITKTPKDFYKNHDYAKLLLMGEDIKKKQEEASQNAFQTTFGYMFMGQMYEKYKELHPFFYDEVFASIKEYDSVTEGKNKKILEKQGNFLNILKERKSDSQNRLKKLKLEIVAEQETTKRDAELRKAQVLTVKVAAQEAKKEQEKKMAEEAKDFDIKVHKSQNNDRRNMEISKLERQLKDFDSRILEFEEASVIGETKLAMDIAKNQIGGDFGATIDYIDDIDADISISSEDRKELDGKEIAVKRNQRVFLKSSKYGDISYIYLLNNSCRDFNPHSQIWLKTGEDVDIKLNMYQSNKTNIVKPAKNLLTSTFGKKFNSGDQLERGLEECSEYRLRSFRARDRKDYEKKKEYEENQPYYIKDKWDRFNTPDLFRDYDMWTIQKNITRPIQDDDSEIEDSLWMDLADIRMKHPTKLSSLDGMILSNNEYRRKRALESLINYVSWPDIPDNYEMPKEEKEQPINTTDISFDDMTIDSTKFLSSPPTE